MEAIRQIYEKLPQVIVNPPELQDQHVEVIWQPVEEAAAMPDELGLRKWTVEEAAAALGVAPTEIRDLAVLKFAGCMPDFPARAAQSVDAETDCE